jgi:hypothetical protein
MLQEVFSHSLTYDFLREKIDIAKSLVFIDESHRLEYLLREIITSMVNRYQLQDEFPQLELNEIYSTFVESEIIKNFLGRNFKKDEIQKSLVSLSETYHYEQIPLIQGLLNIEQNPQDAIIEDP